MTVCAGGRYNGLVEQLGGPETPGIGFGIGVERLLLILEAEQGNLPTDDQLDVYVVGIGAETDAATLRVVQALRQQGISADRDYLARKPKGQFKTASRLNARYTLTIGQQELANQTANLKEMATGTERQVSLADVEQHFNELLK